MVHQPDFKSRFTSHADQDAGWHPSVIRANRAGVKMMRL
jgi:hypothetical protein